MKSFKILIQYFCINKYKLTNLITSLGIDYVKMRLLMRPLTYSNASTPHKH